MSIQSLYKQLAQPLLKMIGFTLFTHRRNFLSIFLSTAAMFAQLISALQLKVNRERDGLQIWGVRRTSSFALLWRIWASNFTCKLPIYTTYSETVQLLLSSGRFGSYVT